LPHTPEQIDRIVARVVDRAVPEVPYSASTLTADCRQLIEWSLRRHARTPYLQVKVFSEQNISDFVRSRSGALKDTSRSNLRARLRRVAEVVAPPRFPAEVERFEPADPASRTRRSVSWIGWTGGRRLRVRGLTRRGRSWRWVSVPG
jgi:hypothetical protein